MQTELYLEGVHCSACVWLVEKLPRLCPRLVEIRLDLPRSRCRLVWDPRAVSLAAMARLLDSLGYAPHPSGVCAPRRLRRRIGRCSRASGSAGRGGQRDGHRLRALRRHVRHGAQKAPALFRWASLLITVPSVIWGGGVFFRGAWTAIRVRTLHMDLPISIGLLAGFLHGAWNTLAGTGEVYFDSVTTLIFLPPGGALSPAPPARA